MEARGRFESRHAVFIDNRHYKHQPGYYVMMPLRIAGSEKFVLVNRGWIAAGAERNRAPAVTTPEGEMVVRGTATPPSQRFLELSSQLDVQPVIIQQIEPLDDGLIRDWPPVDLKRNTHLAYAVQWFALAAAIFIYYLVINVRRKPGAVA